MPPRKKSKPKPRALDTEMRRLLPPATWAELDAYAERVGTRREVIFGLAVLAFFTPDPKTGQSNASLNEEAVHSLVAEWSNRFDFQLHPGEIVGGLSQFFRTHRGPHEP